MIAFTPALAAESVALTMMVLGGWLLLALTLVVMWPISNLANRGLSRVKGQGWASLVAWLSIATVAAFAVQLAGLGEGVYDFLVDGLPRLGDLLWYPLGFVLLVVVQLYFVYRMWMYNFWWPTRRWHYTLFAIAQCALVWFFSFWNLLPEPVLDLVQGIG